MKLNKFDFPDIVNWIFHIVGHRLCLEQILIKASFPLEKRSCSYKIWTWWVVQILATDHFHTSKDIHSYINIIKCGPMNKTQESPVLCKPVMLTWNTGDNDFSDVLWRAIFICLQNFEWRLNYTLSHCSHCIWSIYCSWPVFHSYCREILRPAAMQPNQTQYRSKQVPWTNIWNKAGFFKTTNKAFFHCRY